MKFKISDIVSHSKTFNKFYVVLRDHLNGQYLVEDAETKEQYIFMAKYLLDKSDRRNYVIDDLLDNKLFDKNE